MLEQVELACSAVVRLTGHEEDYYIQLPDVALSEPLSTTCRPTLSGVQLARGSQTWSIGKPITDYNVSS